MVESTTRRYAVVNENGELGDSFFRATTQTERYGATIAQTEENQEIVYLKQDEDGTWLMPAHLDIQESAVSQFSPAIVLAPAQLNPGEQHTSQAAIRVVDRRNSARVKERGTAIRTIEYVGDQRVRTPLGEFIARRVEVNFLADLRLADAEEHTILFIDPDDGIIAEQTRRQVKVLGAFSTDNSRTIVLMPGS